MSISRNTRTRAAVAAAGALAFALAGCSSSGAEADSDAPIIIGVAVPSTGGSAILGEPMHHGIELAVEALNEAGGIDGRTIEIVQEDTGADDQSALNAFNRLVSNDPAAIIGFPVSTQGFAVATQVERTGIPVVMGGTNARLAAAGEYIFDMAATDAITSTAAVQFAVEELGFTKLALLRESGELGTGASEIVTAAAEQFGAEIVTEEIFQSGDVDLAAQANNLRGSGAEMLFVYGQQTDYPVASNALATAGVALPTFIAGLQPATYAELNQDAFETIYNRNQCVPSAAEEGTALAEFNALYEAEYGEAPAEYAAVAYDGMTMLGQALTSAGTEPEALQAALAELPEYEGVCGMHVGGPEGNLSYGVTLGHYTADGYVTDVSLTVEP
jgi:branched-chain amino acid transport system substrate-binding protein